jgi:hypothetical protein
VPLNRLWSNTGVSTEVDRLTAHTTSVRIDPAGAVLAGEGQAVPDAEVAATRTRRICSEYARVTIDEPPGDATAGLPVKSLVR